MHEERVRALLAHFALLEPAASCNDPLYHYLYVYDERMLSRWEMTGTLLRCGGSRAGSLHSKLGHIIGIKSADIVYRICMDAHTHQA
jgi:hypothetical protein